MSSDDDYSSDEDIESVLNKRGKDGKKLKVFKFDDDGDDASSDDDFDESDEEAPAKPKKSKKRVLVKPKAAKRVSKTTGEELYQSSSDDSDENNDRDDDDDDDDASSSSPQERIRTRKVRGKDGKWTWVFNKDTTNLDFSSSSDDEDALEKLENPTVRIMGEQFERARKSKLREKKKKISNKHRLSKMTPEEREAIDAEEAELKRAEARYLRTEENVDYRKELNPKRRQKLKQIEAAKRKAARKAALSEILLVDSAGYLEADGELERTDRLPQEEIIKHVDVQSARKGFDLALDKMGPYISKYSRNGRSLLLCGNKGHVAVLDWTRNQINIELQVKEQVFDATFLHDESLFAVAQHKYAYIYDRDGVELHCLRKHINPTRLEFLPYHFLLVSTGRSGFLSYQDVATGTIAAQHASRLGACRALCQNPWNAIMHMGHGEGTVTMWSPNITKPLVKMFCHRGAVLDMAVDAKGTRMVTSGSDSLVKVWDLRNTYQQLYDFNTIRPVSSIDISQRGLIGLGYGPHVELRPAEALHSKKNVYLKSLFGGENVTNLAFCPYEDVLGVGHSGGFSSLLVPGAGEPNYDTFEVNPFQTSKQRREHQVHLLLDKIQPSMISLEAGVVGRVDPRATAARQQEEKESKEAKEAQKEAKRRTRGKDAGIRTIRRRNNNIHEAKVEEARERTRERKEDRAAAKAAALEEGPTVHSALQRFKKQRI